MVFSRQGYWSGLLSPGVTPGNVLDEHGGRSLLLQMGKLLPRGKNQFAWVKGAMCGHGRRLESRTSLSGHLPSTTPGPKAAPGAGSTQCLAVTVLKELLANKQTQSPPNREENHLRL